MGSRETTVLKLVLWLVGRYLREKYRLVTPDDLNRIVDNYLSELLELGYKIVKIDETKVENHDKVSDSGAGTETAVAPPRMPDL